MPDNEVKTIRDEIFFQYAKIIVCSARHCANGKEAKKKYYGFIKKKFHELRDGEISWSDITREDWQFVQSEKRCIYCGSTEHLQKEHIVPKSIKIKPECENCERILGIHNQIYACAACNGMQGKGDKGLYTFYHLAHPDEEKFYDIIPPLAEKKYLKTIYYCHQCAGTLMQGDLDGDGKLTALDLDFPINKKS